MSKNFNEGNLSFNIHRLAAEFDQLKAHLSLATTKFTFIALTET